MHWFLKWLCLNCGKELLKSLSTTLEGVKMEDKILDNNNTFCKICYQVNTSQNRFSFNKLGPQHGAKRSLVIYEIFKQHEPSDV